MRQEARIAMQTGRIDVGGAVLNVVESGVRGGSPLLLLNPGRANLRVWDPFLPVLEPRWRVIRHDHRGAGASEPARDGVYQIPSFADDAARLLEALRVGRAAVVGAGFSARTALQLATLHPERVIALALFDATVFPPVTREQAEAGERAAAVARREASLPEPSPDPVWFTHADPTLALSTLASIFRQPDQSHLLPLVACPTLIACGREDPNWDASVFMSRAIADCEFAPVEAAGHGSLLQQRAACAEILISFLKRVLPAR
jgi:pimeloyl-ACP methyl ester carboxylesterase